MKRFLFILRKPAHSGAYVQEMLDVILTTAAFEQSVSLLLLDDAVFHLKKAQSPDLFGRKDTASVFKALAFYDVNDVYVETESLEERGINMNDLAFNTQTLYRKDISDFISSFQVVFPG